MSQLLWKPSQQRVENTLLYHFICAQHRGFEEAEDAYDAVWQWSLDEPESFWRACWDFCGVVGDPGSSVIRYPERLIDTELFPQAQLNYAENLLARDIDGPALIFCSENGERHEWSRQDLLDKVSCLQQALKAEGVGRGDRVAGYLPNLPETVAAMLATTSLGAVWSSCSPDFGLSGLVDRFGQIEPKVLFTADGYCYNGKPFDSLNTVSALCDQVDSIAKVVVIPYANSQPDITALGSRGILLDSLLTDYTPQAVFYTRVSFRDPLFILFSSGTTGLPKCFVHSVGGTLLHHLKEHQLQGDIRPGDRMLYFTTCGWAMWNWQVSALASGASLVLFEGSPTFPDGYALAQLVQQENVTHFGTSAKYLDSLAKKNVRPIERFDFPHLRTLFSTGSPLSADGFVYVYDAWKSDVCLSSISGGTDVIGCFVGANPIGPVYAGQCQKRHLGQDVQVYNEAGEALLGEPGELVCRTAHAGMPLGFLNDPGKERYFNEYFSKFDNVWYHGDWVELTPEGGMIFYGRSDATLNPGGVRIGTAEIYRQVENIDEILEALVIGQNWDNDVRVILFVRLRDGVELNEALVQRVKAEIRANATPRHVPAKVIAVSDLPRTHSGKISELAVKNTVHGRPVKNRDALSNPEVLELFAGMPELQI
ncbi:acetoacetate--CoA ligase [Litorivivens sp.]|uniref:acetoacetate--CoA ligase n=2 Tax=Litorivivens sp. TaxID=2020868 RepID=UPI0035646EC7